MIDLHTHSTASDGNHSPSELMRSASLLGMTHIALTDHDTLAGLPEAETAARNLRVNLIRGIELEIQWEPGEFHILGLGFPSISGPIVDASLVMQAARHRRNERILASLMESGISVTEAELVSISGGSPSIGRPHIADLLVARGAATTRQDAFDRFIGKGKPFYMPRDCFTLPEVIDIIHASRGRAIIAHPLSLFVSWGKLHELMGEWKSLGVDGIEAWHPTARKSECERLEKLALEFDFRITAGSDFHGARRPDRRLGHTAGDTSIEDRFLDALST